MEREGEVEMKRRGRREGEMRKGLLIGGMILGLLMGCNNGGESAAEKGLSEIIASSKQLFLDAFVSFGDFLKGTFAIDANTTKKAVGEHLDKVGKAVNEVKVKLESLKGQEQFKLMTNKADEAITKSIKILENIVNGTNEIEKATSNASSQIANAGATGDAVQASENSVKGLVKGINLILGAAKEANIDPKGSSDKQIANSAKIAKLFKTTSEANDADALKGANRAVNTASGADILAAIEAAKGKVSNGTAGEINAAKDAFDIAAASKSNDDLTTINTNASVIAAGLALKAMAQGGKLATHSNNPAEELNAVLIGAVDKTVNEIVTIIRKTVDKCLKDVSDCIKEDSSSVVKSSK